VVRENNSTYRLSYDEMLKDASKMSQGLPEYLLLFRKPPTSQDTARADEPVTKNRTDYSLGRWQVDAHSVWRSNGDRPLNPDEMVSMYPAPEQIAELFRAEQLTGAYNYERHVQICEELEKRDKLPKFFMLLPPKVTRGPVDMIWDDVVFMRSLNSNQSQGRREKHLCPLPFDIVERVIRLYSNEGDLVGDPFGGLGTVAERSIRLRRRAWTCELNQDYFVDMVHYCQAAELNMMMPTLFSLAEMEAMPCAAGS
jgi:DNA modification methylase